MKFLLSFFTFLFFILIENSFSSPLISGISSNEIKVNTEFEGAQILLFGAKSDAGNVVITIRGPRKDFIVNKKENILGVWYNGQRVKFKQALGFYSLFSTFNHGQLIEDSLSEYELGKNNIKFNVSSKLSPTKINEFRLKMVELMEEKKYYESQPKNINFLDETLFKIIIDFPSNILLGTYIVEIYLVNNGTILSYQSIPIFVEQVGINSKITNFSRDHSFIYGLIAVVLAILVALITNYFFIKFVKK
ncbi:MAG: TIGR02186 family protein [Alphaproteobacteria bacterium]